MKAVKTENLLDEAPMKSTPKLVQPKPQVAVTPVNNDMMKPKTYSVASHHVQQINALAAEMSAKEGKPISSSVALRHILDLMAGKTKA